MKTHHKRTRYLSEKYLKTSTEEVFDSDLDELAYQLVSLAKKLLPDGSFKGVIRGLEGDVRQDAIMLAFSWYLRGGDHRSKLGHHPWHAPRAVAGALRIVKRDTIKSLKMRMEASERMPLDHHKTSLHPAITDAGGWKPDTMRWLTHTAIHIALKSGKISQANAAVAHEVLVDGAAVNDVAKRSKVHRSNIYQHLSRVRKHLPAIIDSIELPLNKVL